MTICKSIAVALIATAIAVPAAASETIVGSKSISESESWQRLAQAIDEFGNPLPPRKRRQPGSDEAAPLPGPDQKKVRRAQPNASAPDTASGGQMPPPAPEQKKARKDGPAPEIVNKNEQARPSEPAQRRLRKDGPNGPTPNVVTEERQPSLEPLPRKPRRNDPKRPARGVVIEVEVETPSSEQILRRLEAPVRVAPRRSERVTIREFKRRPELRRAAPSIDIQSINFAFGSAAIPPSQYGKVERIADALERLLRRRSESRILIEGHTDAVGSDYSNQILSEQRAASLKRMLVREFGLPSYVMETVGYGEEFLLVPTQNEDWRNRRVTLRRIDDFIQ